MKNINLFPILEKLTLDNLQKLELVLRKQESVKYLQAEITKRIKMIQAGLEVK